MFLEFIKPNDRKVIKDSKGANSPPRKNNKSNEEIEKVIRNLCIHIAEETSGRFIDLGAQLNPVEDEDSKRRVNEYFRAVNNINFEYAIAVPEGANINGTQLGKPTSDSRQ